MTGNDSKSSNSSCGHEGIDWNGEGDCITCARDKVLDGSSDSSSSSDNTQELDVNKLEQIIADHNKEMRTDMASEITGGTRSKSITDVITVKAILDWHNKQIAKARLNEVQSAYEYWINGRKSISSYFRDRITELSDSKEAEL